MMMSTGGLLIGGVAAHTWVDLITVVAAAIVFFKLRGGRLAWPFLVIALAQLTVAAYVFLGQPAWIATSIGSALILLMTLWFWEIFRVK